MPALVEDRAKWVILWEFIFVPLNLSLHACFFLKKVVRLQVTNITYGEVLIFWSDSEIKTK